MLTITYAKYVSDYTLELTFSNGEVRFFDFTTLYSRGIFRKLQDPKYFQNFTIDDFTVDWNNEIGFAPEFLYEHSQAKS